VISTNGFHSRRDVATKNKKKTVAKIERVMWGLVGGETEREREKERRNREFTKRKTQ